MSQHDAVKGAHPEGLVTSDSVQGGRKLRLKLPSWSKYVILAVLFLVIAGGLGYYAWKHPITHTPASKDSAAVTAALDSAQRASTPAEKHSAYAALGTAYLNNGQPTKAVEALNQAITYSSNPTDLPTLEELATAQEQAGDKAASIATLQKVIAILKTRTDSLSRNLAYRYQAQIKRLQGSK